MLSIMKGTAGCISLARAFKGRRWLANFAPLEQQVEINGYPINYVKVGTGPHHILCCPGALGSIWTDFKPQVEYLNREKFTVVAWDPPGYGRSCPPKRDFSAGFYERDAESIINLKERLNITKFSLLGWSNGGIASMIAATKYPEKIHKLVVWGSNSYVTEQEIVQYEAFRDHNKLSPAIKAPLLAVYGEEYYNELWNGWLDASIAVFHSETKGDICRSRLPLLSCPTLVIHGEKDRNIAPEHPNYLMKNIPGAKLYQFKDSKHNLHLQFWKEFNRTVEQFLLQE